MPARLRYLKHPKLKQPILVVGLPGIGNIGKLAAEYLIHKLSAARFLEVYSEHFPEWATQDGGQLTPLKVDFYHCRPPGMKNDMVLMSADAQAATPLGQYALTGELLEVANHLGIKLIGALAAYVVSPEDNSDLVVVGGASDAPLAKLLSEKGVKLLKGGAIVGMNGMLPSMASRQGMRGFCLLGVTEGAMLDATAAAAVLKSLSAIIGFKLDIKDLEQQAAKLTKLNPPVAAPEVINNVEDEPTYIR